LAHLSSLHVNTRESSIVWKAVYVRVCVCVCVLSSTLTRNLFQIRKYKLGSVAVGNRLY